MYKGIGERGALVGGVATPGKLANGDPLYSNGTELVGGVAPLANREIGRRSGTMQTSSPHKKFVW